MDECIKGHFCTSDCGKHKDCPCQYDHCCDKTEGCEGEPHCEEHYEKKEEKLSEFLDLSK